MRTEPRALTIGAAIALHLPTDQRSREISWLSAEHEAEAPSVLLGRLTRTTDTAPGPARLKERLRFQSTN